MLTSPSAERPRRTQEERRNATRERLLEATVEALIELGYAGTTTLEVERRAGVSRGARIHHFPSKAILLTSAVDHLFHRLGAHYDTAFGGAGTGSDDGQRLRSGLRLLWSIYRGPEYLAALELNMAARTDVELRAQLGEVSQRHRALAIEAAHKHFPSVPEPLAAQLVESVVTVLLGLLVQRNVEDDPAREDSVLSLLEALVVSHLPASSLDAPKPNAKRSRP
jgi:AcrR family transcriptional regulator